MPSIFTHMSLPKCSQCLGTYCSPRCFPQAPAPTSVCLPPPGLPLWCFGFPVTPVGLGHCLPFLGVHLERGIPLLSRCYWLNSRAPSAVPVTFCPQMLGALLSFFGSFIAAPPRNSKIAPLLVTAELKSSRISFILHFA